MSWLLGLLGAALLALTTIDIIWTTMTLNGPGPISGMFYGRLVVRLLGPGGSPRGRGIGLAAGPIVVLATLLLWFALTWIGWWIIFSAFEGSVEQSSSGEVADASDRLYFAGYTVMTLGVGDFRPRGALWQAASVVAAFNGFALVTLAISYLIPILSAVVEMRQFALSIANLGDSTEQIIRHGWDGDRFEPLTDRLAALSGPLVLSSQRLLSYPPLLYFRSDDPRASIFRNLPMLDEVLNVLEFAVVPEHRPHRLATEPLRRAIGELLDVTGGFLGPRRDRSGPPPADLAALREGGIPVGPDDDYQSARTADADRLDALAYLAGSRAG